MKIKLLIVLVVIIGGLAAWYTLGGGSSSEEMGEYSYTCEDGSSFTMTPASDLSWVAITPGDGATFSAQTLSYESNVEGMKYFGSQMALVGVGEGIELRIADKTTKCSPLPSDTNAPWNWGDVGEGTAAEQNLGLIAMQTVIGKWRSSDDAQFVREFKSDGTFIDWYGSRQTAKGLWFAFTRDNAPATSFEMKDNVAYIQLADSDGGVLYFQIIGMSPSALSMIYMDRGGVLNFTLAQ